MQETLQQRFMANEGAPIEFNGMLLYWTYRMPVAKGDTVTITFRDFIKWPIQGVAINCDNCKGSILHSQASKFQVWTHTAPQSFDIHITKAKHGAQLALFNIWTDKDGGMMLYRLNNASMRVEPSHSNGSILRCSDGHGFDDPTFTDLVMEVTKRMSTDRL